MKRIPVCLLCCVAAVSLCTFSLYGCSEQQNEPESEEVAEETAEEPAAEPYQWDEATSTLTLTNANLTQAITFEKDATIVLVGNNTLKLAADSEASAYAIDTLAGVRITGDGTLDIQVSNTSGNAGGIAANTLTMGLGNTGKVTINAQSAGKSGRGVFVDNGCTLSSGEMSITATSNGVDASAIAVYAKAGDLVVDKDAKLNCDCTSANGPAAGLDAYAGSATINGALDVNAQAAQSADGVMASNVIATGATSTTSMKLASSSAEAIGLFSYTGSCTVNGKVTLGLTGLTTTGGIWAPNTLAISNADMDITAVSTADSQGQSATSVHDGIEEARVNTVYGIASDNGITVKDSSLKINATGNANPAHGVLCGTATTMENSWLEITAKATASYSYGIYGQSYAIAGVASSPAVGLDGCGTKIEAGTAAIASDGALTVKNSDVSEGGTISSADGLTAYRGANGALSLKVVMEARK